MSRKLAELVDGLAYCPTDTQRKVKAAFHRKNAEAPLADMDSANPAVIEQLTGSTQIRKWWTDPAFRSWFTNKAEYRDALEATLHKALAKVNTMLDDPELQHSAAVNLLKLLIEASDRMPAKNKEIRYVDSQIAKMSPAQLDAEIKRLEQAKGASHEDSEISEHPGQEGED